jgi:hypothetical protein
VVHCGVKEQDVAYANDFPGAVLAFPQPDAVQRLDIEISLEGRW